MNELQIQVELKTGKNLLEWGSELDEIVMGLARIDGELNSEVVRILKHRVENVKNSLVYKLLES